MSVYTRSTSAEPADWLIALDGGTEETVRAIEGREANGRVQFFSGRVYDEVPEVVASYRLANVVFWRKK